MPGLDIRGDGGQVVAAPSMHITGRRYEWDGLDGFDAPILPAPAWLLDLILSKPRTSERRAKALSLGAVVPEGGRNSALTRLAGVARRRGSSVEAINAYLQAENRDRCKPPLPQNEVRRIAESVGSYAPADATSSASWRDHLILTQQGSPKPILANAILALREASEWVGALAFNDFSGVPVMLKAAPWGTTSGGDWTDSDDIRTAEWLQHNGILIGPEIAHQAVQVVAELRRFHPVRQYLDALEWDGTARLNTWLSLYVGVEPSDYAREAGRRWLIQAVARVYRPGCKADACLILEGLQGIRKSMSLRTLAEPWFTDEIADLGTKDAALQTRGVWVIELAELESLTRAEAGRIKAFMSRAVDRFRPPYGRRLLESPRQNVFAGTVNGDSYLKDDTGGRRFWPVRCGEIEIEDLKRDRDQLWAEAKAEFDAGTPWWLDTAELVASACEEQTDRWEGDPWEGPIAAWTHGKETVSIEEVLTLCVEKPKGQWTQQDRNRVARCLRASGWERFKAGPRADREWRYRRVSQ